MEKSPFIKTLHAVNLILVAVMTWLVLVKAENLPARIPVGFATDGTPNRYGSKSVLVILMLAALFVCLLFYIIGKAIPAIRKRPKWISMPNKEQFLALPEEKQMIYWDMIKEFMFAFAAGMNFIWLTAIWGTIRVASGEVTKLPAWAIWPGMILILALNVHYIWQLTRLPKKLISSQHAAGPA